MKLNINYLLGLLALLFFAACEPQEIEKPEIGAAPTAEGVSFTITQVSDFTFKFENTSSTPGIAHWDLGNGMNVSGDVVEATYSLPDTYTIKLTLVTKGGVAANTKTLTQDKTDYSIFTDPVYVNISGGTALAEGKTWVVDSLFVGHFGIGPAGGTVPEWWSANPLQKTKTASYDDEFTFNINGFGFDFENNGWSYAKDYRGSSYTNSYKPYPAEGDLCVALDPAPGKWAISQREGTYYLTLIGETPLFFGFDYGATNNEYRIESVTENELRLSCIGGDGNRWYNILIPKGYSRPVEPEPEPEPKQLKELDLHDNFEGTGNIVWNAKDVAAFETIPNFAPVGANTSSTIKKYVKAGFEWTNVSIQLPYLLDLSKRNVFKMKVFMPNFNDYDTQCDPGTPWIADHSLNPQIDVKLQNSLLGGDAWSTQEVRGHVLSADQIGKWVELTFDFSNVSARQDFDQIIVQFGAEGHCNHGWFYFDDFELLP